jgi:hypothetical protein
MYFLIEHNRTTKETHWTEFGEYSAAQIIGLQKEQGHFHAKRHEMEVVVFEANSIDDLKRTHSRYFVAEGQNDNPAGNLLAIGLIGLAIYLLNKK